MIYQTPKLEERDFEIIDEIESLRKQLLYQLHNSRRWYGSIRRLSQAKAIQSSTNIEGYTVSEDDALAAVLEDEKPTTAKDQDWYAITGYQQAMSYILQIADDPHPTCGPDLIRSLHFMLISYEPTKEPGRWRSVPNAIRDGKGHLVYETPDAEQVPELMTEFVKWINTRDRAVPTLVRAAMSHLNLVLIHPFRDGNGRMARCLQSLVLTREGVLGPEFCSIEEYLGGENTARYYNALDAVGKGRWSPHGQTRTFVRFCLTAHYTQAHLLLIRTNIYKQLWDSLEKLIQERSLPERTIYALSDASFGYRIRNSIYRKQADVSENTASHDLKLLTDAKLLVAEGARRGRTYRATKLISELLAFSHDQVCRPITDPYSLSANGQRQLFAQ
jgi:Fic family protein